MAADLYIVLYESVDLLGRHKFKTLEETFTEWPEADLAAKATAATSRKRAWVAQIGRPNLIELVK